MNISRKIKITILFLMTVSLAKRDFLYTNSGVLENHLTNEVFINEHISSTIVKMQYKIADLERKNTTSPCTSLGDFQELVDG